MKVVGYSDRLSTLPGETIRFMVSCKEPSYRADLVRLIHGDPNPEGPGYKEERISSSVDGEYPGQVQTICRGSHVAVPDSPLLHNASFTLQAWIYPTTPQKGVQGILTKWSNTHSIGYGLFIDDRGHLALWIGSSGDSVERLSTHVSLRSRQWYFVAGIYDSAARKITLYQEPTHIWPGDRTRDLVEQFTRTTAVGQTDAPFLMAGYYSNPGESGDSPIQGHFNGKVDNPRLFNRALNPDEIAFLRQNLSPTRFGSVLVASWDLSLNPSSTSVTDTSSNGLHGTVINMPMRAVTGHNWTGRELKATESPSEYGAIYFHDDDIEDAGWDVAFEYVVPNDMKSGVYAARLKAGEGDGSEDYLPFFVRSRPGAPSAPILFLAPTASYMAYANFQILADPNHQTRWERIMGEKLSVDYPVHPQDRYMVEQRLLSLYDRHSDYSGVCYSSRLRPILNMRPRYLTPTMGQSDGFPHQFNADLCLLDWMEFKGHRFDVATDEDLHIEGTDLLSSYRVVVTGTHPEYWSRQMLYGLESYLANGGRLMYLGGNGFYWVTSFDPHRPHIIEVRRWLGTRTWEVAPGEMYHSTTGELGGLWRFQGRPPQEIVGVGFTAQGGNPAVPFHRAPGSFDPRAAFIFEGVKHDEIIGDFGLIMGAAGGDEIDRADLALGTPPHTLVLATASGFSDVYQHVVEEVLSSDSSQAATVNPLVRGDMVYFEQPKGGAVFSVGSITWCGSLSHNSYENNVSLITDNVLTRFSSDEPIQSPS